MLIFLIIKSRFFLFLWFFFFFSPKQKTMKKKINPWFKKKKINHNKKNASVPKHQLITKFFLVIHIINFFMISWLELPATIFFFIKKR